MQAGGMRLRTLYIIFILITINCISLVQLVDDCKAEMPILYVGHGEQYSTIQSAINFANANGGGYRIYVYNGTYNENLTIPCKIDLFGEDKNTTIISGGSIGDTITINSSHVNISRFKIQNSGNSLNDAVIKINYDHSIITDNYITGGYHGIFANNSEYHIIYDNRIESNTGEGVKFLNTNNSNISYNNLNENNHGIFLYNSQNNNLYNNILLNNVGHGVFLNRTCISNTLKLNNLSYNSLNGIYINDYSNYTTISANDVFDNGDSGIVIENGTWSNINQGNSVGGNTYFGMMIVGSNITIHNNNISSNLKDGIHLSSDNDTIVKYNKIGYNTLAGLRLLNSTNDYVYHNEIFNNSQYGMYVDYFAVNNNIYDNYFYLNNENAIDKSIQNNHWNLTSAQTLTESTNIVGGSKLYGNYWDDFDEPIDRGYDNNSDGIIDADYQIYNDNYDYGPLADTTDAEISEVQARGP
jgi:parallel beta-helix repeat protein